MKFVMVFVLFVPFFVSAKTHYLKLKPCSSFKSTVLAPESCLGDVGVVQKCLKSSQQAGWPVDFSVKICESQKVAPFVDSCIRATSKLGFKPKTQQKLCSHAKIDTASCLEGGAFLGWSWNQIRRDCRLAI